jgi:hypothetical protein
MLFVTQATIEAVEHARAMQMHDAFIDQQLLGERFREMQRGGHR